jgi:hypothetical protein
MDDILSGISVWGNVILWEMTINMEVFSVHSNG